MKVDICLPSGLDWRIDAAHILQAESFGCDAAWSLERLGNPFFPLTIAAKQAQCSFTLGTIGAYALPRSPMVTAQIAWDLARQTDGRFVLGLDAQTPGFQADGDVGQPTDSIGKMREYIESLRAIWRTFQNDERLRFRGQHYQFRLMAPFFNPGPIDHPEIPIFLSGDDSDVYALAGELCQGVHANVLHTRSYLCDVVVPSLSRGLENAGRPRDSFELAVPVLVFTSDSDDKDLDARNDVKQRIASHAINRTNRTFMAYHGWEDLLDPLRHYEMSGERDSAWHFIPEEVLREIAIVEKPAQVSAAIRQRYSGFVDRVCLIFDAWSPELIATIVEDLKSQPLDVETF